MKKKILLLIVMFGLFIFVSPVYAANIASCESSINGVIIDEKIPNIVSTIINVIKIVVPVLLVIMGMIDLMKGVTAQKEDEMKKGQQIFVKRLISGALVFFVFTIVQLIVSFVADDEEANIMTCASCFITGDCTYLPKDGACDNGRVLSSDGKYCK